MHNHDHAHNDGIWCEGNNQSLTIVIIIITFGIMIAAAGDASLR
ncbi:hypothetical protein SPSIL_046590 [Sporomusa silvacetica DSM 10669]|uniref:Uncharacterized protein n=1 Tax=Sporomusa silvacetica DSM 10669 TaxID=1123289 RepID=A0ABZ3IRX8_9FIRM|nr:hypothetical protein [Sporomusa silvacetica]OZC15298.1 hypothetical protein SPSIL_41760 [Sporomusa silvacetica DSM 10669]